MKRRLAPEQQRRAGIFVSGKLTIGLDLGDRNSWYCVLDESGQIQLEQRVRTNAKALRGVFGAMGRSRMALEIGTHSPWISRLLGELGHEVIVANARKVRLIGESRKKDDRLDAQTLARLARIDPEEMCLTKRHKNQLDSDRPSHGRRLHSQPPRPARVVSEIAATFKLVKLRHSWENR